MEEELKQASKTVLFYSIICAGIIGFCLLGLVSMAVGTSSWEIKKSIFINILVVILLVTLPVGFLFSFVGGLTLCRKPRGKKVALIGITSAMIASLSGSTAYFYCGIMGYLEISDIMIPVIILLIFLLPGFFVNKKLVRIIRNS